MQIISPRPYQMMHSEQAKVVQWYIEETNNIIARQTKLFPDTFRGVCGLPQTPGVSPKEFLPYLEKLVKEDGFVGCLLNPDPSGGHAHRHAAAGRPLLVSAVRKAGRARHSRPHSLGRLPLGTADRIRCTSSMKRASRSCRC